MGDEEGEKGLHNPVGYRSCRFRFWGSEIRAGFTFCIGNWYIVCDVLYSRLEDELILVMV